VKLTLDGDSLEVTAVSSEEQDLLVELSIALKATDLRTIRRHGVDRKCALSSTNDIGYPNRPEFRRPLGAISPVMGLPSEVERR
jgi:hypothetical protein